MCRTARVGLCGPNDFENKIVLRRFFRASSAKDKQKVVPESYHNFGYNSARNDYDHSKLRELSQDFKFVIILTKYLLNIWKKLKIVGQKQPKVSRDKFFVIGDVFEGSKIPKISIQTCQNGQVTNIYDVLH